MRAAFVHTVFAPVSDPPQQIVLAHGEMILSSSHRHSIVEALPDRSRRLRYDRSCRENPTEAIAQIAREPLRRSPILGESLLAARDGNTAAGHSRIGRTA